MEPLEKDKIELLKNSILAQAKYFLDSANEFFTFGSVIDKNNLLKPISMYSEEDMPDSQSLYDQLDCAIKKGLDDGDYVIAAIALDIFINTPTNKTTEKRTGIQIKYSSNTGQSTNFYLYQKNKDGYLFDYYDMN